MIPGGAILRQVSRTFALTLGILPRPLRRPITIAYLLARTTDTIADTEVLPKASRLDAIARIRDALDAGGPAGEDRVAAMLPDEAGAVLPGGTPAVPPGATGGALPGGSAAALPGGAPAETREGKTSPRDAERVLIDSVSQTILGYRSLPPEDRRLIADLMASITRAQVLDIERFHGAGSESLGALRNAAELDEYTYGVAGAVGEFWTRMLILHRRSFRRWRSEVVIPLAVRFGKGLQMTNIIRDLPRDLRQGRCYIPLEDLAAVGLAPADLLDPARLEPFRPILHRRIAEALAFLDSGWRYTLSIPRREWRIRLACAWPVIIAVHTLEGIARSPNPLDPDKRIKVSHGAMRRILAGTAVRVPSNTLLDAYYRRARALMPDDLTRSAEETEPPLP